MRSFTERIAICLVPILLAAWCVGVASARYMRGEGGTPSFRFGVDLVGGTILVYEVDLDKFPDRTPPKEYSPQALVAAIKRRIDPNDLYNVTIRPVSTTRVEIILPTGGAHQARIEDQNWQDLLQQVRDRWLELKDVNFDRARGQPQELVAVVKRELGWKELLNKVGTKWPKLKDVDFSDIPAGDRGGLVTRIEKEKVGATEQEIDKFVRENETEPPTKEIEAFFKDKVKAGEKRQDISAEQVQYFKDMIKQVGSLDFRILANEEDDKAAVDAAQEYFKNPANKNELDKLASDGLPPPPLIRSPTGEEGFETTRPELGRATYTWFELGRSERKSLGLNNDAEKGPPGASLWWQAKTARDAGEAFVDTRDGSKILLYSRKCQNAHLTEAERADKAYDYFVLVRDPERDPSTGNRKLITGKDLVNAKEDSDRSLRPAVSFKFNTHGGDLFYDVTNKNRPTGPENAKFYRHLAIILDGQVMSAPRLITAIQTDGQITGNFTSKEVNQLVSILRAGALPATLKPLPVSENTIGATLGEETIRSGTFSVGLAFAAVLVFMIIYYRFAGLVACVALLANLLLTIGFMVIVNATFTLPGLAGLVLMLGMAVDANVLIYERLREERDRGASLALAIRNGYDRAFPTIIDTHLTSIFTAIVLYAVGNDQLKGFGISLTVGLIISLFTSLYMTRLLFDLWLARGWLHKLSMFRLLSRTNIDFMRIRYAMFALTVFVSLAGITVFLIRGKAGLNIDFVGGTAYTGQLNEARTITELRDLLEDPRQKVILAVRDVKQTDSDGHNFLITYQQGGERQVSLATAATPEQVKERAETLPDWSVEQIFLSNEPSEGDRSRVFTVRSSEKEADLVMVTLSRLLRQDDASLLKQINLESYDTTSKEPTLTFSDYASPGRVQDLLVRTFKNMGIDEQQPVDVRGVGENHQGSYKTMRLILPEAVASKVNQARLDQALETLKREFGDRPQPLRLENFDSQLALETQTRALYAILASWAAILLYLWFRFGSWTFGLAAVLCLIHDLFFTLGVIAFSHFIHIWFPGVAHVLGLQDFKIDLPSVAALLTLVGYSVSDTIVVFDRIREVRGKNPELTPQMINDSVNQTLSRTLLTAFSVWLVVTVLYIWGGEGVHLFAFVMVAGVIVGTYSSIYIASPLLLIFGEGRKPSSVREPRPVPEPQGVA